MTEKEDDIAKLFQSTFDGLETPIESGEWENLQPHLQKWNFLHFNAFQFNIYYASMIIFCFITCAFVGTHYTYTNFFKKDDQISMELNNIPDRGPDMSTTKSTVAQPIEKEIQVNKLPSQSIEIQHKTKDPDKNSKLQKTVTITEVDSAQQKVEKEIPQSIQAAPKPDSVKPKPKRVVYITKQDTIIQFDTIQAPKKKKKWFK